jgi:hypothetical protein
MQERVDSLSQQNTQLLATVEGLEKERDFYFEKLVGKPVFFCESVRLRPNATSLSGRPWWRSCYRRFKVRDLRGRPRS